MKSSITDIKVSIDTLAYVPTDLRGGNYDKCEMYADTITKKLKRAGIEVVEIEDYFTVIVTIECANFDDAISKSNNAQRIIDKHNSLKSWRKYVGDVELKVNEFQTQNVEVLCE